MKLFRIAALAIALLAAPASFAGDLPLTLDTSNGQPQQIPSGHQIDCTVMPAFTGDVANTAGTCPNTIQPNVVSNSKLATAPANTWKGNQTNSTANESDNSWPSCSGTNQSINYTSGSGLGCKGGGVGILPQGRLGLNANYAVPQVDVVNSSVVYYTCGQGGGCYVPYWDGSKDQLSYITGGIVSDTMPTSGTGVTNSGDLFDFYWDPTNANICHVTNGSGGGWASDSTSDTSHTGNTHTSTTVDAIVGAGGAFGWQVGDTITGSGFQASTHITALGPTGTQITLDKATTTSLTGTTLTVTGGSTSLRGFSYSQRPEFSRGYGRNQAAISHCYNASTDYGSSAAGLRTYLGTVYTTGAGTTSLQLYPAPASGGSNTIIGVYNAYNRRFMSASSLESTGSWNYTTATWRPTNNSSSNRITYIDGLGDIGISATGRILAAPSSASAFYQMGLSQDSTTSPPAVQAQGGGSTTQATLSVTQNFAPLIGKHFIQQMEDVSTPAGTVSWFASGYQLLTVSGDF